jgi:hypothetical protein
LLKKTKPEMHNENQTDSKTRPAWLVSVRIAGYETELRKKIKTIAGK